MCNKAHTTTGTTTEDKRERTKQTMNKKLIINILDMYINDLYEYKISVRLQQSKNAIDNKIKYLEMLKENEKKEK